MTTNVTSGLGRVPASRSGTGGGVVGAITMRGYHGESSARCKWWSGKAGMGRPCHRESVRTRQAPRSPGRRSDGDSFWARPDTYSLRPPGRPENRTLVLGGYSAEATCRTCSTRREGTSCSQARRPAAGPGPSRRPAQPPANTTDLPASGPVQ
jgi:hypothetical protein